MCVLLHLHTLLQGCHPSLQQLQGTCLTHAQLHALPELKLLPLHHVHLYRCAAADLALAELQVGGVLKAAANNPLLNCKNFQQRCT